MDLPATPRTAGPIRMVSPMRRCRLWNPREEHVMGSRSTQAMSAVLVGCVLAVAPSLGAQAASPIGFEPTPREDTTGPASIALDGTVSEPSGAPAEGAVVVSSAGGRAITDVAGHYRLEVSVPSGATS